jgi:hypothetical protein
MKTQLVYGKINYNSLVCIYLLKGNICLKNQIIGVSIIDKYISRSVTFLNGTFGDDSMVGLSMFLGI